MQIFKSSYNHGELFSNNVIKLSENVLYIDYLSELFSNELNVEIKLKKVYLGIKIIINNNIEKIVAFEFLNNKKELKREIRRLWFNNRSEVEDVRREWELFYSNNNLKCKKKIKTHIFKYKSESNVKINKNDKLTRRQKFIDKGRLYGQEEVEKIYESARILRKQGFNVNVDHIIPIHAVNEKGEWVACGLHVPSNLKIMNIEENNKKGNFWYN